MRRANGSLAVLTREVLVEIIVEVSLYYEYFFELFMRVCRNVSSGIHFHEHCALAGFRILEDVLHVESCVAGWLPGSAGKVQSRRSGAEASHCSKICRIHSLLLDRRAATARCGRKACAPACSPKVIRARRLSHTGLWLEGVLAGT